MADTYPTSAFRPNGWINKLAASARFRQICARLPGLSGIARAEGAAIFDLMQGFVRSQMLAALVEFRVLHHLSQDPATPDALAARLDVPVARLAILLQSGAAMGLLRRRRDGRFALARRGSAFLAVPGLEDMVRHHSVLYRDLTDPAAFLRGETDPELARFWPYVFGAEGARDAQTVARYSRLMADSQGLVADEALAHVKLNRARALLDVGGGTGAFLRAVRGRYPDLDLALFDLPDVVAQAALPESITRHGGSFRDDPLPQGADVISLVRVLYDHSDDTVAALLRKIYDALPQRGRVLVIEPMSGGARPDPQTDVYFAVYTLAMKTGRTRSPAEISSLLKSAGFGQISGPYGKVAYIAQIIEAYKSG